MTTFEKDLINKSYYKQIVSHTDGHPVRVLGEMYMDEKKKEMHDFSNIRFSQGEVYFHNKDYEAAIFKWENIDNELKPWALKNIADAHFEMDLLAIAEDYYMAVKTDSVSLKTEVLLQLFSLNLKLDKREKALGFIKNAVHLNPDYSDVTDIARSYFEENKDYANAVELAVNEAIRTKSLSWFKILGEYVEQGHTVIIKPDYFDEALQTLYHLDPFHFETLAASLWNSYKQTNLFFSWLKEINNLLLNAEAGSERSWKELPELYKETYFQLISGKYLINDFSKIIPLHLTNWLKVVPVTDSSAASTAVLAWQELFPASLDASLVGKAEKLQNLTNHKQNNLEDGLRLYDTIKEWAEKEGLGLGRRFDYLVEEVKMEDGSHENLCISKVLSINKKVIEFLIGKRVELENSLLDKIQWNEELLAKLNGIQHQLHDMEEEKAQAVKKAFRKIKGEFRQTLIQEIPELLRNCSDVVKEDSDFGKVHIEINEEMNKRIATYMEEKAVHQFQAAIQDWMKDCEDDLQHGQSFLNEMSESIHQLYNEEKMTLVCDFKVLDDWKRDVTRMMRGIAHHEKTNIMMRSSLSQIFLKSAGKLLGQLSKNKEKLQSKYKKVIESTDYSQIAHSIVEPFIQQLDLFEKSIPRDISMFFAPPFEVLSKSITEVQGHIDESKESLNRMRNRPEIYRDPLTLFELKVRQYELMNGVGEKIER